ncbi:MAG: response regulator, partial [Kiritimatiellae bacterium]|nr:response regulator [Kiritimatiellia bacterium]
ALALAALSASGAVPVAQCVRDAQNDEWAAADVAFGVAVMQDVFRTAGVETEEVPFLDDGAVDTAKADVICAAFRTPDLEREYAFPVQPLDRMHFALYAVPARAKEMLASKITDWPRMRVGYSPVSLGVNRDRELYFEHATLSPEYVEFPTSAGAVRALKDGAIDALFLYTPMGRRPEGLVEVVPIGARNIYFAVRRSRPELLKRLADAYRTCYIDRIRQYDEWREELLGVPPPERRVRVAAYLRGHLFDLSPSGERSGVIEDWLNAIAGHTHWSLDYVYGSYEQSVDDVASGRLDCVGGLGFTASRGESLLYPHTPMGMLRVYLWTKSDSRFKPGDQATWRGIKVGLLSGSFSADRVKQQLKADGNPTGIVCREYKTDGELMKAYFDGEIDACVDIEMPAVDKEKALHVYASHPMYICVSPKRRDLFLELEKALDLVCDDFPKYMKMISERHYGIRDEMSLLTFEEAEWLKERAKNPEPVRIDFSPWPVNLKNDKGETVHFAKEFLDSLSRRTGLAFDVQPQTGIQTAQAKFLRGDTQFWIPYPAKADVAAMGGVSVAAIPVPKTYAHMIDPDGGGDELEIWANRDVPDELAGVVRKAVAGIEPAEMQEMFIKAATERTVAKRLFGMSDAEFERLLTWAGFAVLSAVALFGVVMVLLLRHQVRRANEAAKVAEEYSSAKTRFLAMMSHELRTPLNAVIGFAEFLARADCDAERRREYITGIQLSANTLLDLINDVLDLSKLDSGAMHMLSGECDVTKTVEELPAIFNYRVRRTGVPLVVRHMSRAPVPVLRLSQQGLKQILVNLVGNSSKFTAEGSITIDYGWEPATNTLKLSVADTGCGISPAKMERLFDPFVQDIASRMQHADAEQRGTGLGLPIAKRMVDNAGGTIDVTSEVGKGTRFAITIPGLEAVRPSAAVEDLKSSQLPAHILVVDDIPINRKVLGIHLKNLGVEDVRFAENGRAALEQMKGWTPGAVLTDMWMPVMDGQQLAAEMKKSPALAQIPVMAITADADVASTYDMSAFAKVIAKPVTSEKLRNLFADL